jgi:hypothetical protein
MFIMEWMLRILEVFIDGLHKDYICSAVLYFFIALPTMILLLALVIVTLEYRVLNRPAEH